MIDILCYGGSAGAFTFAMLMIARTVFDNGLCAVPNAFNLVIERTVGRRRWKAEVEAEGLAQRIAWLENCSRQWEDLRAQGRDAMWTDVFGWIAGADVCPCGYLTECAIWCGDGHKRGGWVFATDGTGWQLQKGQCDHDRETGPVPYPGTEYTAPCQEAVIRPLMWDVEGAGGKYER